MTFGCRPAAVDGISRQFFGDEYRIKGSVLVINPAYTGGISVGMKWPAWHRDADHGTHNYYSLGWPAPLVQLRFFIALSDCNDASEGGLAVYPGSHRCQVPWPHEPSTPLSAIRGAEVPRVQKGDCMLMHHGVMHTALPNPSSRDRVNVQFLTCPSWVRSKEAESYSPNLLTALPDDERERILAPKW